MAGCGRADEILFQFIQLHCSLPLLQNVQLTMSTEVMKRQYQDGKKYHHPEGPSVHYPYIDSISGHSKPRCVQPRWPIIKTCSSSCPQLLLTRKTIVARSVFRIFLSPRLLVGRLGKNSHGEFGWSWSWPSCCPSLLATTHTFDTMQNLPSYDVRCTHDWKSTMMLPSNLFLPIV